MKKVLLGIGLILFGFNLTYVSINAGWSGIDVISFIGLVISLINGFNKDK